MSRSSQFALKLNAFGNVKSVYKSFIVYGYADIGLLRMVLAVLTDR